MDSNSHRLLILFIIRISTGRIARHEVLLPINRNHLCQYWSLLKIQTQDLLRARARWRSLSNYLGMTRTVVSQRTIEAELRTGDLIANQIREGCLTQNPTRELRMTKEGIATTIMWPRPPPPSPSLSAPPFLSCHTRTHTLILRPQTDLFCPFLVEHKPAIYSMT